jgi:hypothetical protein
MSVPSRWQRRVSGWNKIVAIITLVNLLLGLFNLSYVPLRDIYIEQIPTLVSVYDPVKGIEPHPDTQHYLQTVDRLTQQLQQASAPKQNYSASANSSSASQTGAIAQTLSDLRQQSASLIDENPFLVANKFGTFATLKRRMRQFMNAESAKEAFFLFWSQDYLTQADWQPSLSFFDREIRPLMARNYFRYTSETGQFVDRFWQIDAYFIAFFILEFLGRTLIISRRQASVSWIDAMLRRWYDCFLFIPTWRWLRAIPVAVRLHQSGLVNMERALAQVTHEPAAYLADRVSEYVMVRLVNQTQTSISEGGIVQLLNQSGDYIRVSATNKVDAISDRLLQLTIYNILPQVQPHLKALLRHSLEESFKQFEVYQNLQSIPAVQALPNEAIEQLSTYLSQTLADVLAASYSDIEGRKLLDHLTDEIRATLRQELQQEATQQELQQLLVDLLEELKLNYIQRSPDYDPESMLTEVNHLHRMAQASDEEDDAENSETEDSATKPTPDETSGKMSGD